MTLIIDPPVSPASSVEELESWIRRLEAMRKDFPAAEDQAAIDRSVEQATRWLEFRAASERKA